MDHCNGLVLYGRDDYGEVYVCNPMTRRWVELPLLSQILMRKPRAFLVFDPAVSLHYEVLVVAPLYPEKQTLPPADEWPPSRWAWHVFSSRTGRWRERAFVREGDAAGTVADMLKVMESVPHVTESLWRYAAYWQGALYVHCQGEYVSRLYVFVRSEVSGNQITHRPYGVCIEPERCCGLYKVADHCNGLVLYWDEHYGGLYVCNPTTRRWVRLPPLLSVDGMGRRRVFLVFNPSVSQHYEVLVSPLDPEKPQQKRNRQHWTPATYNTTVSRRYAQPAEAGRPRIDGKFAFVVTDDEHRFGWYKVADHCNGLVLYRDEYSNLLCVCNPTTRRWVRLPQLTVRWNRRAFVVFNPAVSPHYEVLVAPLDPGDIQQPGGDEPPAGNTEWPPSRWTWHVFSSRTGRWRARVFVREGEATGIAADMVMDSLPYVKEPRWRYAVYWQ
ncbi:hypothetical protein BAE44_0024442 [Dichanthelium oligosanthes]|uniref:F-box associated domain-containing protein n=1 Tax=Dichanthelium oligosanthes TaxID=888268 RepID=A0A1E5UNS8_9POAL|nr:hypothetical protein BAE44_0024442 [Dichanthelium oligosanthes]